MALPKKIAVVMGSDSDFSIIKPCIGLFKDFGVQYEIRVMSAHRTPKEAAAFAENADTNGFGVIIAAAGKAAHLAGILAAHTTLPIIGIPIKSSALDGLDALLSTVQMPKGVPVATVGINCSENAALLAIQILSVGDDRLKKRFGQYKDTMRDDVLNKDNALIQQLQDL